MAVISREEAIVGAEEEMVVMVVTTIALAGLSASFGENLDILFKSATTRSMRALLGLTICKDSP